MLLQTLVLEFEFQQRIQPCQKQSAQSRRRPQMLALSRTNRSCDVKKHSHGHVSTRVRFGDHEETPARAFSRDEVRIADYFEEDLFYRRWRCCWVSEGVGFTEEPRVEL